MKKLISELTTEDLSRCPVWSYSEDKGGSIVASPVRRIPVRSLESRLVGCQVSLSNGQRQWADLTNINLRSEKATSHFITLSVTRHGKWFHLARYFDVDYDRRGPSALGGFLGLSVKEIFPIHYDIGPYVVGAKIPTSGMILEEPLVKLSQEELIALSLE